METSPSQIAAACDSPTIGDIFRKYGPAYLAKYREKMPIDQIRAMQAIMRCRMPEMGTAVYRCKSCSKFHFMNRPCGNRHCPSCQGNKAHKWKQKALSQLLPSPYFMLTFTVPAEVREFIRSLPKECYRALMQASSATLLKLAKDPKYVGSKRLGFTSVLHTWGRDLCYHPHVHALVPGGAISKDGASWLPSRLDFLVPIWAASKIFRAKFKSLMEQAGLLEKIPKEVWKKGWNVNCKAVGDGRKAVQYLAPYIFRVAISNRRIKRVEPGPDDQGLVTYSYRPSGTDRYKSMTVSAEEFIRRFVQHVLPRGFQKVRHYGFAHPRSKTDWEWLKMMVTTTLNMVYVLTVMAKPIEMARTMACPDCGGEMLYLGTIQLPNTMRSDSS